MGPQPPSLPHTGASRRARRSPFADTTKGVWCRLPPQLLSRSSYAWFWPYFYWKLPIHSAARFSAAPDTETRFPCLQTRSGPRNIGDRAQTRRKAPEVPEQAVVLGGDACTVRGMSTISRFREGKWGLSAPGSKMGVGFLSGRARAHQFVVALDFQLAAVEYCVVAQVGVKTDILAGRRVLVSGESAIAVGPSLPFPFIPNDSRHSVTAMRLRSVLPACWPWCQRRTHSRRSEEHT